MNYKLYCLECQHEFEEDDFYNSCPECGGVIDTRIKNIKQARPDYRCYTIMKWHRYLPIDDYWLDFAIGHEVTKSSPMILSQCIGNKHGVKLWMKDETIHQTGTMKDREGLLTIIRLLKNNKRGLSIASSGNAGISLAWYATMMKGPHVHLYLPECSRERMEALVEKFTTKDFVTVTYVEGSTDEAGDMAKKYAIENDIPFGTGFRNYSRREGVKTLALEYIFENRPADWYFQGCAGALAMHAFYKAHKELSIKCPRIVGVQPDACSPFVDAYRDDAKYLDDKYIPSKPVVVPEAPVLKSRKPIDAYPIIKAELDEVDGYMEKVSSDEIFSAFEEFKKEPYFKDRKIPVGLEASTALAGIIKMRRENIIKKNETVLLNVSGLARPGDIKC